MRMCLLRTAICASIVLMLGLGAADAAIVAQHLGLTDPSTEGFTLYSGTQQGGTDTLDYWEIYKYSNAGAAYINGVGGWDDPSGWTVTTVAKVVQNSFGYDGDKVPFECAQVYAEILDSADRWDIHFIDGQWAEEPQGWTMGVYVIDDVDGEGVLKKLATVDVMQYHTYQVVYDPASDGGSGEATYYVDGVPIGKRTRAQALDTTTTTDWIAFGSPAISYRTTSRWNEFTLETGQHPDESSFFPGDANLDNKVDAGDAAILAGNWLKTNVGGWTGGDFNVDGLVDDADATLMATNWLHGVPMTSGVPEPGIIALLSAALASLAAVGFMRRTAAG